MNTLNRQTLDVINNTRTSIFGRNGQCTPTATGFR
jgi:hypothetical protein